MDGLPPADLTTFQLELSRRRAERTSAPDVLRRAGTDRFVRVGPVDARVLWDLESRALALLPREFAAVTLSPLSVQGTCAATAGVSQNRVVSTVRGTEVSSDPTNALAVVAADRWRDAGGADTHLATVQHVVRAQQVDAPGARAHFRLLALVSVGHDRGSGATEADLLRLHVRTWQGVLRSLVPGLVCRITLTPWGAGAAQERVVDTVLPAAAGDAVPAVLDEARTHGEGYYAGVGLGLRADVDGAELDLGDGGTTTWAARLLGNAKVRCVVSCLATERLAQSAAPA